MAKAKKESCNMQLCAPSLGMAFGVTWGLGALILGIAATYFGYGEAMVELLGTVYLGYDATPAGFVIGTIWAIIDGFIGGVILAWLYNKFNQCCGSK